MKDLNYYKNNCEEDYIKTPISVLRYITELEKNNETKQLTLTDVVKSLKDVSKIVDKIVEESPLLCMPDDKQMQRDYLKEKWTKWFKKEYKL